MNHDLGQLVESFDQPSHVSQHGNFSSQKLTIIILIIGIISLIISLLLYGYYYVQNEETHVIETYKDSNNISKEIEIDIGGAVNQPGVYQLPKSARIHDAITKAGGLGKQADLTVIAKTINLAQTLQDGQKLYIPFIGENIERTQSGTNADGKININNASQKEIETLPRIGPRLAQAIIAYRQEHGLFTSVEELNKVPGIGDSLFEQIKPLIIAE